MFGSKKGAVVECSSFWQFVPLCFEQISVGESVGPHHIHVYVYIYMYTTLHCIYNILYYIIYICTQTVSLPNLACGSWFGTALVCTNPSEDCHWAFST